VLGCPTRFSVFCHVRAAADAAASWPFAKPVASFLMCCVVAWTPAVLMRHHGILYPERPGAGWPRSMGVVGGGFWKRAGRFLPAVGASRDERNTQRSLAIATVLMTSDDDCGVLGPLKNRRRSAADTDSCVEYIFFWAHFFSGPGLCARTWRATMCSIFILMQG